ncbi:hypothetical protein ES703_122541 [subsurface metagenome]
MDICIHLFSASVALAGFIAVFMVFRYRTMDTYVDARKDILISSLLKGEIEKAPYIAVRIEDIGKDPKGNDARFFHQQFNNQAVDSFVNNILAYRSLRKLIVCLGLWSIGIWGVLSLVYLIIYAIGPCLFSSISCSATLTGISIGLFTSSMVFTLCFVFISLLKKPE